MRLSLASVRRVVKGDLTIQFVPQALTSYGGLERLGRYLRRSDLGARLRPACAGRRSDYGSHRIVLVLLALFSVGARRLEHRRSLRGDPVTPVIAPPPRARRAQPCAQVAPAQIAAEQLQAAIRGERLGHELDREIALDHPSQAR